MTMVDFKAAFAKWLRAELEQGAYQQGEDADEAAQRLYERWCQTPQQAFGGQSPARYFENWQAEALVRALLVYAQEGDVPEQLCDAIAAAPDCAPLLAALVDKPISDKQNLAVIERLSEMQYAPMFRPCMRQILSDQEQKAEQSAQALKAFGLPAAKAALDALNAGAHSDAVADRLADIVASCGPCEGASERLCALFSERADARAFYAQCLAKVGGPGAVDALRRALNDPTLGYYEFNAVRDAIEALGEEADVEREFSGDRDYDAITELT